MEYEKTDKDMQEKIYVLWLEKEHNELDNEPGTSQHNMQFRDLVSTQNHLGFPEF